MILVCGIPSEPPIARVLERLRHTGVAVVMLNQRHAGSSRIAYEVGDAGVVGQLSLADVTYDLADVSAVYLRLQDDRYLPEVVGRPEQAPERQQVRAFHAALIEWTELTGALVVNRFSRQASNGSKPYQAQLIQAAGFAVPETLVTNDPDLVRAFLGEHGRLVYKSTSGVRSIVSELDADALGRLDQIRWCPVQFQRRVDGLDVRVHVLGDDHFATAITTDATDYRYAARQAGSAAELSPYELDHPIAARCVELAAALGLPFAGIDLRLGSDGAVYCFEVNPSPAYSYYEAATGQPISAALAALLSRAAGDAARDEATG